MSDVAIYIGLLLTCYIIMKLIELVFYFYSYLNILGWVAIQVQNYIRLELVIEQINIVTLFGFADHTYTLLFIMTNFTIS